MDDGDYDGDDSVHSMWACPERADKRVEWVTRVRLELTTYSLEGSCSIQLSYQVYFQSLDADLDRGPAVYKTAALPLSYPGTSIRPNLWRAHSV